LYTPRYVITYFIYNCRLVAAPSVPLIDPPQTAFGYQTPVVAADAYGPWADPEFKTIEEILQGFDGWVTEYYNHPDYKSLSGLLYGKGDMLNPLYARLTVEERERIIGVHYALATDAGFGTDEFQAAKLKQTMLALFDEELAKTLFPEVRISHIACSKSFWPCLASLMDTERLYKEYAAKGKKGRPIRFVVIDGANHVVCPALWTKYWRSDIDPAPLASLGHTPDTNRGYTEGDTILTKGIGRARIC
jgi:hypothetical protein